jgi:hypothetical protein
MRPSFLLLKAETFWFPRAGAHMRRQLRRQIVYEIYYFQLEKQSIKRKNIGKMILLGFVTGCPKKKSSSSALD